jgi:hypothetical protein
MIQTEMELFSSGPAHHNAARQSIVSVRSFGTFIGLLLIYSLVSCGHSNKSAADSRGIGSRFQARAATLPSDPAVRQSAGPTPEADLANIVSSDADVVPEPARSADGFVNSIGVATHFGYHNSVYGQKYDQISKLLGELGVRIVRDGFDPHLNDLWKRFGTRAILITHPSQSWNAYIAQWKQNRQLIAAIEGPNEVNGRWEHLHNGYERTTWPNGPKRYQNDLFEHVKHDPELKDLPVICLSTAYKGAGTRIAPLASFNFANAHSYAGGGMPSRSLDFRDSYLLLGHGTTLPPIVATESGYHTCLGSSKVIAAAQAGISHEAHRKYIPRQVAEYFNAGFHWDVIYEFAAGRANKTEQEDPEAAFGLLMPDGTPKPAYFALKDLIALTAESKWDASTTTWIRPAPFTPQSLAFALRGAPQTLHHLLLQRSDGAFQLLLWNEVSSWDLKKKKDIVVPDVPVRLVLANKAKSITVSRLGPHAPPEEYAGSVKEIDLKVPDEVIVVGIQLAKPPGTTQLNPPAGVVVQTDPTSVDLSWPFARNVSAYWISLNDRNLGQANKGTDGQAHFTMGHLIPSLAYDFEIVAASLDGATSAPTRVTAVTVDAFPDLVVRSLKVVPESPKEGDALSFVATIENVGSVPTESGVMIGTKFAVDGKTVCWSDNVYNPIAPGQRIEVKPNNGPTGAITWVLTHGTHHITAFVDDQNRIAESNEANNQLTITTTTGSSPDLVVREIKTKQAHRGKPLIVDVVIANQGTDPVPKGSTISATLSLIDFKPFRTLGYGIIHDEIPVGGAVTVTVACGTGLGNGKHQVRATADDVGRIAELKRSNNQLDAQIEVAGP